MTPSKNSELQTAVGARLAELRKIKGYDNGVQFARDFHLPPGHYWKLENGKANLTLKTLVKVLAIHNTTLTSFFASLDANHS